MRDVQGALPIHYACQLGSKDLLQSFNGGCDQYFKEKTYDQKRPIDIAAEYGHLDIVEDVLTAQTDDQPGIEALVYAAIRHKNNIIVSFLKSRPLPFPDGLLHAACRERHGHQSISCLEISSAELQKLDSDGLTPLAVAVKYRRFECVKALLDTGYCEENVLEMRCTQFKRTVLHICAGVQNEKITSLLIDQLKNFGKKRFFMDQRDAMGDTPLHICAQIGNTDMCEKLLELYKTLPRSNPGNTAIWNLKNYKGWTPFQEAVANNQLDVVKTMLNIIPKTKSRMKMIQVIDSEFRTCLHVAAWKGKHAIGSSTEEKSIKLM